MQIVAMHAGLNYYIVIKVIVIDSHFRSLYSHVHYIYTNNNNAHNKQNNTLH